ncbi:TaqI-like C-terminal specificity domain-containing protein, partial [Leuconostoc mesenteroides]|uniref:TaqI-like C-terminal specificity domain-containing protein n=1 Tax=Leuconostoc mesenteroides TaxID=1245 RepID=UPI002362F6CE
IKVIDLGDSKVFDAAILPAIFIGQKIENAENSKVDFQKIYEVEDKESVFDNSYNNIFEALDLVNDGKEVAAVGDKKLYNIETGTMLLPDKKLEPWTLSSIKEIQWANNIKKDNINFSDVFDVHVGIKTTADKVFIRNDWDKFENSSEKKLLHPLIYSKNIKRWTTDNISLDRTILYPYELVNDKRKLINLDKYPLTKEYLTQFYTKLDSRTYLKKAGRAWYEVWVPQNPILMKKPKVVFPDISNKPKFSLDLKGYLVDGNCYWLSLKDGQPTDYLYLAVIVANSVFLQKFHDIEYQNKLYSGKRRYLTQYVSNYPIPNINNNS